MVPRRIGPTRLGRRLSASRAPAVASLLLIAAFSFSASVAWADDGTPPPTDPPATTVPADPPPDPAPDPAPAPSAAPRTTKPAPHVVRAAPAPAVRTATTARPAIRPAPAGQRQATTVRPARHPASRVNRHGGRHISAAPSRPAAPAPTRASLLQMKPHPIRTALAKTPSRPVVAGASSSGSGGAATLSLVTIALVLAGVTLLIAGAHLPVRTAAAAARRTAPSVRAVRMRPALIAAARAVQERKGRALAARPKTARPTKALRRSKAPPRPSAPVRSGDRPTPRVAAPSPAIVAPSEHASPAPAIALCTIEAACEIRLFRGYVKAQFVAVSLQQNGSGPRAFGESPWFRWPKVDSLSSVPEIVTAHDQLLESLTRRGWVRCGRGSEWYGDRLERAVAR
jgi:hypothetical protein